MALMPRPHEVVPQRYTMQSWKDHALFSLKGLKFYKFVSIEMPCQCTVGFNKVNAYNVKIRISVSLTTTHT